MKRTNIILIAFALAMTMSQCKKNEVPPVSIDEVVTITLDVNRNNSSKVVVNPATGTVDFESGDKIYVGSGGKYVGFLTHNGTNFSGNITNPTENQPLQFYFLGNVTPSETLSAGTTEECSVIISDQTERLPVISCAASNENFVSGVTAYSAHLLNKCALVKFNVTTPSNSPICITGMKNKVTVDFANNTLTPSQAGEGVIMLPAGSGEKWTILLPQNAIEEGVNGSAYSLDGMYRGILPTMPIMIENGYLTDGIGLIVNNRETPIGAICGAFSVSENLQVFFSKGNLQYQASTNTWRFAEDQWNYVGGVDGNTGIEYGNVYKDNGVKCDNSLISSSYSGWIDLFGWGTSGWNNGNLFYHPYDYQSIVNSISYDFGYGPTDGTNYEFDLIDEYSLSDWGVYNPISNGGNQEDQWRCLSYNEWDYVLFNRNTSSGIRYAKAQVHNVNGIILLPDNWDVLAYSLDNSSDFGYTNIIEDGDWSDILEPNGVVFLPVTGGRSVNRTYVNGGSSGCYWSTTHLNVDAARAIEIGYGTPYFTGLYRRAGESVRLVQNY